MVKDGSVILRPFVRELAFCIGRVNLLPEYIEELVKGNCYRIVGDLHCLQVPCCSGRDLLVCRVRFSATGIPGDHISYTLKVPEWRLHAPETTPCKCCYLHFCVHITPYHQ